MEKIKIANQPVGPFPAMIVGAIVNENPTYTAVGARGYACLAPVFFVSLKNIHYITEGIIQNGYFSVNIPHTALVKELDYCGIVSGRNVDKSDLFTPFYDSAGQVPMITECSLNSLCKICDSREIQGFTVFFGNIVATFANEDCMTDGKPDPIKIDPIIMIGMSYCNLDGIVGQPFAERKN